MVAIKRSLPSNRHLSLIQRLQLHQLSDPARSPSSSLPLITASHCNTGHSKETVFGSWARWFTGIAAGSGLGLLYWFSTSSSCPEFASVAKPSLCFADCSTSVAIDEATKDDKRSLAASLFWKFSLPDYKSKFIFGEAYRRKVFFNYEKRIRLRSPPEKVFEYFASLRTSEGELLMRPSDLMRAVVPVFPPSESHLVRDGYLRGERNPGDLRCPPSEFFMLFDMDSDGLISFKEYIFFVTLLSIPESSFSVAFKMFDVDNNGEIDKEEFKKVMALMRAHNRQGAFHRNGLRTGFKVNDLVENGGLVKYFFGEDGSEPLHLDKFSQFLRDLQEEMLRLEFAHYDYKLRGSISVHDFALSIVASADVGHLNSLLLQVDQLSNEHNLKDVRITFEEFKSFAELRRQLQPFSLALFSYGQANGLLTREDFQRAAAHVCGISLSDNVIEIIFHVFDSNHDGTLSLDEFVRVLHRRERDIAQPVEDGILGFLSCCWHCTSNCSLGKFLS